MKTFTAAALAEAFEVDRSTMVRALRSAPPDLEKTKGRPTYKVSTAAKALERHRRSTGNCIVPASNGNADPAISAAYTKLDAAIADMEAAPSLERRRSVAVNIVKPLLATTDRMLRAAGRAAGHDDELVSLRADHVGLVMLRTFERPCEWSFDEALKAIGV
jgi:hypothetical protein